MRYVLIACLTVGGVTGTSFPVDAQTRVDVAAPDAATSVAAEAHDRKALRNCLKHTGSRIPARARRASERDERGMLRRQCVAGSGRVYTRADLERTGEPDLANALRKLDPSIN